MNIFIHAHYYLPKTLAGAEKYLHEIAKFLQMRAHKVIVSIDEDYEYHFEGITVVSNKKNILQHYAWADAVITHLLNAGTAIELAKRFNKPLFHLLHNNDPHYELFESPKNNFVIYNSEALKKELMLSLPSIVAHPALDYEYWISGKNHYYNEYITLINCCKEKGGAFLQYLADGMPGYRFLGVKGSYGDQIIQISQYRNIQFLPVQTDMRNVYDQTRIVIIPSVYESWSLVASEAMASGIPVICSDTSGLRENCGDAAIYAEQRVQPYREAIEKLNDKDYYDELVKRGSKRNKTDDLNKILKFMEQHVKESEVKEKEEHENGQEKKEIQPEKEKKEIKKPGRQKKVKQKAE